MVIRIITRAITAVGVLIEAVLEVEVTLEAVSMAAVVNSTTIVAATARLLTPTMVDSKVTIIIRATALIISNREDPIQDPTRGVIQIKIIIVTPVENRDIFQETYYCDEVHILSKKKSCEKLAIEQN